MRRMNLLKMLVGLLVISIMLNTCGAAMATSKSYSVDLSTEEIEVEVKDPTIVYNPYPGTILLNGIVRAESYYHLDERKLWDFNYHKIIVEHVELYKDGEILKGRMYTGIHEYSDRCDQYIAVNGIVVRMTISNTWIVLEVDDPDYVHFSMAGVEPDKSTIYKVTTEDTITYYDVTDKIECMRIEGVGLKDPIKQKLIVTYDMSYFANELDENE